MKALGNQGLFCYSNESSTSSISVRSCDPSALSRGKRRKALAGLAPAARATFDFDSPWAKAVSARRSTSESDTLRICSGTHTCASSGESA